MKDLFFRLKKRSKTGAATGPFSTFSDFFNMFKKYTLRAAYVFFRYYSDSRKFIGERRLITRLRNNEGRNENTSVYPGKRWHLYTPGLPETFLPPQ